MFSLVGLGMPSFWFGIILIIVFAVDLHWFSVGGWGTTAGEHLRSLVLPGLDRRHRDRRRCSSAACGSGMLEVIESDFVAAARAKGLRGPRVLLAHVARNALIPTVTLLGINIAYLIGSTVVIERVFDLNGLGNLMLNAIGERDFPVVQGVTIVYAIAVVVVNLMTDLDGRPARPEDQAQVSDGGARPVGRGRSTERPRPDQPAGVPSASRRSGRPAFVAGAILTTAIVAARRSSRR